MASGEKQPKNNHKTTMRHEKNSTEIGGKNIGKKKEAESEKQKSAEQEIV